ncbi:amidohydrolase family protein [Croceicoccus sp. F390]|uniref:Amidohydrolase family protein n=1 Tax=Croceicoccus esteveae TaxID=3075597 RepID=A0ABU2ZDY2_9SPHN|nr:amidohydrolase family protein [Croceicoccus sp. F390]MDT0574809.1 amidohydrolase family protein [Croceicoccus sp. F390]
MSKFTRRLTLTLAAATALASAATPLVAQDFAVTGATVATGDARDRVGPGTVVVRSGRIVAVGPDVAVPAGVTVIDGTGMWITPGLFAPLTDLGLFDVGGVQESNDRAARNSTFSAALDYSVAVNPINQHIMTSRAGGVTRASVVGYPAGSIFAGQGALIDLGADPDVVTRARAFQMIAIGETGARLAGGSRVAVHALLRNALREAREFGDRAQIAGSASRPAEIRRGDDLPLDPRLVDDLAERGDDVELSRFDAAALRPVVQGTQPLYVVADRSADILQALALRQEFPKLDLVLVGAAEGWMVADRIAAAGVPVIAPPLIDLPERFEQLAATQSNIGRMVDAGVTVALGPFMDMEQPRNAPQYAGNLVGLQNVPGATGLTWSEAFAAITSVPAQISGMGGQAGVLAPGALGDVVIWDGDPLEVSSTPVRVFVDGVEQPLTNHQTRLRERYRDLDEQTLPKAYSH